MNAADLDETGHGWYDRAPLGPADRIAWPGGRPVAFAVMLCAESYDIAPRAGAYAPVNVPGMFGRGPYPDVGSFSRREYGNRVGFFRIARILQDAGLRATAAIDQQVARRCPDVLEAALAAGWPVAGHGRCVNDIVSSRMSADEERAYLRDCLDTLRGAGAGEVNGWHGAEYGESRRTPQLLAEAGVRYLMDWPHDEQPIFMATDAGPILSVPVNADFDDVNAMFHRRIAPERWTQAIVDAVDTLARDGRNGGRLYVLNLHAWLVGQPYRAHALACMLAALRARDDVWFTTTDEVAAWCWKTRPPRAAAGS